MKKALIIVDVQNDFCEGGSLAVSNANEIIPIINKLSNDKQYSLIVATQDFHPKDHSSFKSNNPKGIWPDHCVQGTFGADFHSELDQSTIVKIFPKGTNSEVDSYSGFFDNDHKSSTGMGEWLKSAGITHVDVVGLALDYCVKATAMDAKMLGFDVSVLVDATRAVNINPNDGERSAKELVSNRIEIKNSI